MERFRRGNFDQRTLIEILPRVADPAQRETIRKTLSEAKEQPLSDLVLLLEHPLLAVRLGTLELLEEWAGGDFSYNPWTPAGSPENTAALARWRAWTKDPAKPKSDGIFTDEQRRGYLQDLLADDADKAIRARRMLESEGLSAVGFLENFLNNTPSLTVGHRVRVREAQYQITLSRQLGDQAATTARQLSFGSRDQVLSALTTVRDAGILALPILRDFITHADPLVRESAIDSLLVTGGEPAVEIVAPLLKQEADVNVIHGALRRLKDIPGKNTAELVTTFLTHADEDLLISAIQTSLSLTGDKANNVYGSSSSPSTTSSPADTAVIAVLSDKRWRVRAAALEYIAIRRLPDAKQTCLDLLDDSDEFVRFAAIKAISALGASEALPKLKTLFMKDENMAGPVFQGYGALKQQPDAELLDRLDSVSPEARLAALRVAETDQNLASLVARYVTDPNLDVACAALRQISGNQELMKQARNQSLVVAALRSGQREKAEAVMERLTLPKSEIVDPKVMKTLDAGLTRSESTALDGLYDALLLPGQSTDRIAARPPLHQALEELVKELKLRTSRETALAERFRAALILAKASYAEGYNSLTADLPTLTTGQKTTIAQNLDEPSLHEALPLLTELLRDPIPEVRSGAAAAALSNENAPVLASLVLKELARPDARLQATEVYSYQFESAARSPKMKRQIRDFAISTLESADSPVPMRILATICLRDSPSPAAFRELEKQKTSPDPLVRRATWHTLIQLRPTELRTAAESIMADPQAFVRVVLPQSLGAATANWSHHFSDAIVVRDMHWSYRSTKPAFSDTQKALLEKLAIRDPSPLVRFEAAFSLLTRNVVIDIDAFATLVPRLPKEVEAKGRITNWLSENADRATPGLKPLLALIDPKRIGPEPMKKLNARINTKTKEGFATFASLARASDKPAETSLLTDAPVAKPNTERTSLEVIYFYKPGCPECSRAKEYLKQLQSDFSKMKVTEHNILEASGTLLNQALCQRFSVPSAQHTLSPAIFTQAGFLVRDDISPQALGRLFTNTMATEQDDSWMKIDQAEKAAAVATVDKRYAAFTLPIVIGAGLLDGINPCAFATMIFFLSYLQIARRTPREMLMVGAAFISAVFIAYLAAGLLLYQSLAMLNDRFAGIQKWMNFGFAALALIAAALSFRDAWRARSGRIDEMTLQLPDFLKNRIRGVIRTGSKARNFVIAAFVSGLVISLLELACTGQVYAPIIYQIQQGRLDALVWLVIYNLAFITPLIVIFLLAYSGLRSESLVKFQKRHTAAVKIGLGILFVVLALVILFSQKWLTTS